MTEQPLYSEKILLCVDGSDYSSRALEYVIDLWNEKEPFELHVLTVRIPINSAHARIFASPAQIDDHHSDQGMEILASALKTLDDNGIEYTYHVLVGSISDTIIRFAKEQNFDRIVMGTHGRTGVTQLLLGSVAQRVSHGVDIPVSLVT